MSKPAPLSGFPEWLPAERIVEQHVLDTVRRVFELHGFASIETRAVEPLEQLLRKGEIDKEVYVVRRLHGTDDDDADSLALHFDLTVPFARYVLQNAGHLEFPFRRYQIQKAWRGERPQEGRFREFTQADVDIIGRDTLSFHHEVEVALVMAEVFRALPCPPGRDPGQQPSSWPRASSSASAATDAGAALRAIDKIDKIGPAAVAALLQSEAGLSAERRAEVPRARRDPLRRHVVRRPGARPRRRAPAARRGPRAARGRRRRGARADARRRRGRPQDRPRSRLLHRHRLRDPARRLRVVRLGVQRRSLRRARERRPHDLPRCRHLARRQSAHGCARGPRAGHRQPLGADLRPGRGQRRGVARRVRRRRRRACARAGSAPRWRPRPTSSASRSASPTDAASPSCGSSTPTVRTRSRTSAAATRCGGSRRLAAARRGPRPDGPAHADDRGERLVIRTHTAGSLRAEHVGQTVTLAGWVARRRDHGGVAFLDLRDASGVVQVVVRDPDVAHPLRNEFCVKVTGVVSARPRATRTPTCPPVTIEVVTEDARRAQRRGPAAVPHRRARRGRRGGATAPPLPRPATSGTWRGDPAAQPGSTASRATCSTTATSSRSRHPR